MCPVTEGSPLLTKFNTYAKVKHLCFPRPHFLFLCTLNRVKVNSDIMGAEKW